MILSKSYSILGIALLAVAWLMPAAQADDGGVHSIWTSDALSSQRGRARRPGALISSPVTPKLDAAARQFFREFEPGEVTADEFPLSTGVWSGLKLTRALGRASNAYHFVRLDLTRVTRVLETQVMVSGIALAGSRMLADGTCRQETVFYVVPKGQEPWLLHEYAKSAKTTEQMAELEKSAFQNALTAGIDRVASAGQLR